ncbi:hypothetical protein, partial [Embleya sp. NPDC055610]
MVSQRTEAAGATRVDYREFAGRDRSRPALGVMRPARLGEPAFGRGGLKRRPGWILWTGPST